MKKILIINPFGIGDVLFSTVLIEILKDNFPQSQLYYICNKRTNEILQPCPELERVFVFEKDDYKRLWRESKIRCIKKFLLFLNQIKKERIDLAFDLSMGHQYSFFLKLINVPERIGFDYRGRGRFLTRKLKFHGFNDKPIAEYYKDLLRLAGLKVNDKPTAIWWTDEDRDYIEEFFKEEGLRRTDTIIAIAPGGGISWGVDNLAFKRWPYNKFAKLAEALIKKMDAKIVLTHGPGEEGLIERIVNVMDVKPIILPETTIRRLAALMSRCNCVVCNDGGPLHVAVAAGARTVSIFGPSDENVYGPYPPGMEHLLITKDIDCRPCYKKFKLPDCKTRACLKELDVKSVFPAVANHVRNLKKNVKIL